MKRIITAAIIAASAIAATAETSERFVCVDVETDWTFTVFGTVYMDNFGRIGACTGSVGSPMQCEIDVNDVNGQRQTVNFWGDRNNNFMAIYDVTGERIAMGEMNLPCMPRLY